MAAMTGQSAYLLGVIEGFYGRPWPHKARLAYADYLVRLGMNSYLYCPKADPYLRKRWQENWPCTVREELLELAQAYSARDLNWGIGLSPFALYQNYDETQRRVLKNKIESLCALNMPTLAILFDDMPGSVETLASRQAEIVADVCSWAGNTRVLVCPTYYSMDPVLEKYFGDKPANYWQDFGREIPAEVEIFWTGNRVCSETISVDDVDLICGQLGRRIILWDNYPVNDGAVRSNFIYSSKLSGRDSTLPEAINGHYCNPMNQPRLSLMALEGLAELHGTQPPEQDQWLAGIFGRQTQQQFLLDKQDFETRGLSGLGEERCQGLASLYQKLPGEVAKEVAGWLRGEYAFDPACLTD